MIARLRTPLLLLVLLAAAGALRAFADAPALLTVAGVLLLVVPGFALSLAFVPGRELGGAFRVILALALSIAAVILSALVLDLVDKISTDGLSIALGAIGAVAAVAAFVMAPAAADRPPVTLRGAGSWLLLVPAAAVAVAALLLSIHSARERDRDAHFAQLSMRAGGPGRVRLVLAGVGGERRYAVRLRAGNRTVALWRGVRLGGGDRWVRSVAVPPASGRVNAVVSRAGDPRADYRTADAEAGR